MAGIRFIHALAIALNRCLGIPFLMTHDLGFLLTLLFVHLSSMYQKGPDSRNFRRWDGMLIGKPNSHFVKIIPSIPRNVQMPTIFNDDWEYKSQGWWHTVLSRRLGFKGILAIVWFELLCCLLGTNSWRISLGRNSKNKPEHLSALVLTSDF